MDGWTDRCAGIRRVLWLCWTDALWAVLGQLSQSLGLGR